MSSSGNRRNFLYGNMWGLTVSNNNGKLYIFVMVSEPTTFLGESLDVTNSEIHLIIRDQTTGQYESPIFIARFSRVIIEPPTLVVRFNDNRLYFSLTVNTSTLLNDTRPVSINLLLNNNQSVVVRDNVKKFILAQLDDNYSISSSIVFTTAMNSNERPLEFDIINSRVYFTGTFVDFIRVEKELITHQSSNRQVFYGYWLQDHIVPECSVVVKRLPGDSLQSGMLQISNSHVLLTGTFISQMRINDQEIRRDNNSANMYVILLNLNLTYRDVQTVDAIYTGIEAGVGNNAILADSNRNIYLSGSIFGKLDFDGMIVDTNRTYNHYISKLTVRNRRIEWIWAKTVNPHFPIQNSGLLNTTYLTFTSSNVVLLSSQYWLTADLTESTLRVSGDGSEDLYLAKIDTNGRWRSINQIPCIRSPVVNNVITGAGHILVNRQLNLTRRSLSLYSV